MPWLFSYRNPALRWLPFRQAQQNHQHLQGDAVSKKHMFQNLAHEVLIYFIGATKPYIDGGL